MNNLILSEAEAKTVSHWLAIDDDGEIVMRCSSLLTPALLEGLDEVKGCYDLGFEYCSQFGAIYWEEV